MLPERVVVIADPDRDSRTLIARGLTNSGFGVLEVGDGQHALRQAFTQQPAAIVLDINLPLMSGIELVKVLRAASDMSIIVVSDTSSRELAVRVLDLGADDYLPRPLHLPELVARLKASLRRVEREATPAPQLIAARSAPDPFRTGPLLIDVDGHVVLKRGDEVPMTRTEYLLLGALCRRAGQVAPHRYLLTDVWGAEYLDDTHYLRGYIASLRNKLEDDPTRPRLLLTEWGVGYRLAVLPPEEKGVHAFPSLAIAT